MYSTTSECISYLKRVASHATKERANGRIDAVPKWAEEPTDYFDEVPLPKVYRRPVKALKQEADELKKAMVFIEFLGKRKRVWASRGIPTDKVPDDEIKQAYRHIRAYCKQLHIEIAKRVA